jgi:acylphosphatase
MPISPKKLRGRFKPHAAPGEKLQLRPASVPTRPDAGIFTMTATDRTVRATITGRVQGVGFRAFVEREAARRGLRGWVRNRWDGSVEAVFAGPPDIVDDMIAACRRGPRASHVDSVETAPASDDVTSGFAVLPTV